MARQYDQVESQMWRALPNGGAEKIDRAVVSA